MKLFFLVIKINIINFIATLIKKNNGILVFNRHLNTVVKMKSRSKLTPSTVENSLETLKT